jgi:RNA polymerase sigma factor (sigma-70 family)
MSDFNDPAVVAAYDALARFAARRWARYMEPEDAVQEAWVLLLAAIRDGADGGTAVLGRVKSGFDTLRRRESRRRNLRVRVALSDRGDGGKSAAESEAAVDFELRIDGLTDAAREAVRLVFRDGLSQRRAAARLGVTPQTICRRIGRAIEVLTP